MKCSFLKSLFFFSFIFIFIQRWNSYNFAKYFRINYIVKIDLNKIDSNEHFIYYRSKKTKKNTFEKLQIRYLNSYN